MLQVQESQLTSYKLAENKTKNEPPSSYDSMQWWTRVCKHLIRQPPAEVRRKLPSQLRRDRRRTHQRYLLSKEDVPVCLNNIESKTNQTPMINRTKNTKPSGLDLRKDFNNSPIS
ncbi:hypothetical protein ElyMa_004100800 [Elysia marginata]|uniref:Uncharacterized protein n=1 Tax=Elysia marginata TaxID=1093978 RepID=A0AAV4GDN9_9GAST|nr:hypothetical protein ElyMa_004100800 [Elysia marginata]